MFKKSLAVFVFMVVAVFSASAQTYVKDSLVAYWSFDTANVKAPTVMDTAGTNNGTLKGDATIAAGKIGTALKLDGNGDFIEVANATVFDFGTGDFSIEAWIKVDKVTRFPIVFRGLWGDPMYAYELTLRTGDPYFGCFGRLYDGKGYQSLSAKDDKTAFLSDSSWHHIVLVRTAISSLYMDGKVVGTTVAFVGINVKSNQSLFIGKDPDPNYFNGMIDEVRLYKKALSQAEVTQNFQAQAQTSAVSFGNKISIFWGKLKEL